MVLWPLVYGDKIPWFYGLWSMETKFHGSMASGLWTKNPWFYGLWSVDKTPWFYGDKKGLTLLESILSVADPGLEPESPP